MQSEHADIDAGHVGPESGGEQSPGGGWQRARVAVAAASEAQRAGIPLSKLDQHR